MKIRIEMEVPDGTDTSDILERAQHLAIELHEEVTGDDGDDGEVDVESISDTVSVEVVK